MHHKGCLITLPACCWCHCHTHRSITQHSATGDYCDFCVCEDCAVVEYLHGIGDHTEPSVCLCSPAPVCAACFQAPSTGRSTASGLSVAQPVAAASAAASVPSWVGEWRLQLALRNAACFEVRAGHCFEHAVHAAHGAMAVWISFLLSSKAQGIGRCCQVPGSPCKPDLRSVECVKRVQATVQHHASAVYAVCATNSGQSSSLSLICFSLPLRLSLYFFLLYTALPHSTCSRFLSLPYCVRSVPQTASSLPCYITNL